MPRTVPRQTIRRLLGAERAGFDLGLLLVELKRRYGGEAGLAEGLYGTYGAAPAGSPVRKGTLELVVKLLTQEQGDRAEDDMLTDDDLERELENVVGRTCPSAGSLRGEDGAEQAADQE